MHEATLRVNYKLISGLLFGVVLVMLALWQPWRTDADRTISIVGEASVKAAPDEFVFYPTYQREAATNSEAISAVSKVGNDVVAKLKELGVAESAIKTSANSSPEYSNEIAPAPDLGGSTTDGYRAIFSLTITLNDKTLAQKVLDYLATTEPLYGLSPQSTFSARTRDRLEAEARAEALRNARDKSQQTADQLGVSVGRVISVSEPSWGGVIPMSATDSRNMALESPSPTTAPVLLTGQETVTYSVTVVFRLR